MKSYLKFLSLALFGIFTFWSLSHSVAMAKNVVPNEEVKGIAIGVSDTKIVSQEGNKFNLSFNINNDEISPFANLKYSVNLIKETKDGQFLADTYVSEEKFSISANSTTPKQFVYVAPSNLSGKYKLFLHLNGESGLVLGVGYAGEVELSAGENGVNIIPESCYLTLVSDTSGKLKYKLVQGVDIDLVENLKLSCSVVNLSKKEIRVVPVYETFLRTTVGNIVKNEGGDNNPILFKANEKKDISLILPKATVPQAYDVKISLKDDNSVSNTIIAHYVIRGASATIMRATLDKDYYNKGDNGNISVAWAPSADSFADSRAGKGTELSGLVLVSNISDSSGKCIKSIESNLIEISKSHKAVIPFTVKSKCLNPKLNIQIKDSTGKVLDQKEFNFISTGVEAVNSLVTIKIIVSVIVAIMILVGIYLILLNKNKKNEKENI